MKKLSVMVMAAAMILVSSTASAQKLSSLLKSISSSDVVNSVINTYVSGSSSVSLPGSWSYTGAAVSVTSDNTLSNLAGSAVTSGIESKVDSYLQKVGIKEGSVTFTFNDDKSFSSTMFGIPLSGTWQVADDSQKVTLQYGKTLKYLSMTGTLSKTTSGCEMLFDADRFMTLIKSALSLAGKSSSSVSSLTSLTKSYSGMKLGYALKKTN